LVYKKKKRGLIFKILIVATKKEKKKINILEFGRELGKKIGHWEFMLLFIFFLGSIII
jgi:hypothetical protein